MNAEIELDTSIRCIAIDIRDCSFPAMESVSSTLNSFWEWIKEKFSQLIHAIKTFYYRTFKKQEFGSFVHRKILPLFEKRDADSYNVLKRISVSRLDSKTLSNTIALLVQEKTKWSNCQTEMKRILMANRSALDYVDARKYPVSSKATSYASDVLLSSFDKTITQSLSLDTEDTLTTEVLEQYKSLLASCVALVSAIASTSSLLFYKNQGDSLAMNIGNTEAPSL